MKVTLNMMDINHTGIAYLHVWWTFHLNQWDKTRQFFGEIDDEIQILYDNGARKF